MNSKYMNKLTRQHTKNLHHNFLDQSKTSDYVRKKIAHELANKWMDVLKEKLFDETEGRAREIFRNEVN